MAEAELASTACNGATCLFTFVVKHAAYPFQVDENVRDLMSDVSQLEAMEKDVLDHKLKLKSDEKITCTVEDWLGKARDVIEEARAINEKYIQRLRFVHIVCSDYSVSRNAVKKLTEVKSLCADGIINNLINKMNSAAAAAAAYRQSPGLKLDFSAHLDLGRK